MPLSARRAGLFSNDEELGKKDDDHRPKHSVLPTVAFRNKPRRTRLFWGIIAVVVLYFFFKNIPTNVPPVGQRHDLRFGRPLGATLPGQQTASGSSSTSPKELGEKEAHKYEGLVKFYKLAGSLQATHTTKENSNVLFLASNLHSASSLIPLACQMSMHTRNRVHFALTGRDAVAIETVKEINGVTESDCHVRWHDGRPDYAEWSSDYRMEVSVRSALNFINMDIMPQVVLVDSFEREDDFFARAFKFQANKLRFPFIELPLNAADNLPWVARLDSSALKVWKSIQVDILIQAPRDSSGSLIRLLQSIASADYFGSPLPRITIELPEKIDPFSTHFLQRFRWPPKSHGADTNDKLQIRHRLDRKDLDADAAAVRAVESFFPFDPNTNHVLVLTPQAELSPSYYHYLKYVLLEYRHSALIADNVVGISLELPTKLLDEKTPMDFSTLSVKESSPPSLFISQSPNGNAALYFGFVWQELHSFISNRLSVEPIKAQTKLVSEKYPSWMEFLLELMRARGYFLLYPGFASKPKSAMVKVHNELYQAPEEFAQPIVEERPKSALPEEEPVKQDEDASKPAESDKVLTADVPPAPSEPELVTSTPLLDLIGLSESDQLLPHYSSLPAIDAFGNRMDLMKIPELSAGFTKAFLLDQGGCADVKDRGKPIAWGTDDLFCREHGVAKGG
ncbi:MAG: hypothetical protein Q9227_004477 [Pyrenula ochraceoflavens]